VAALLFRPPGTPPLGVAALLLLRPPLAPPLGVAALLLFCPPGTPPLGVAALLLLRPPPPPPLGVAALLLLRPPLAPPPGVTDLFAAGADFVGAAFDVLSFWADRQTHAGTMNNANRHTNLFPMIFFVDSRKLIAAS
jgi:hypothetical protein